MAKKKQKRPTSPRSTGRSPQRSAREADERAARSRGAALARFRRHLAEAGTDPEVTRRYAHVVETTLRIKADRLGDRSIERWPLSDTLQIVTRVMPRSLVTGPGFAADVVPALTRWVAFLEEAGRWAGDVPAQDMVEVLGRAEAEVLENFADRTRRSPATDLAALAVEQGVDMSDRQAVAEFFQAFDAMPEATREALPTGTPSRFDGPEQFEDRDGREDLGDPEKFEDLDDAEDPVDFENVDDLGTEGFEGVQGPPVVHLTRVDPGEEARALAALPLAARMSRLVAWLGEGRDLGADHMPRGEDLVELVRTLDLGFTLTEREAADGAAPRARKDDGEPPVEEVDESPTADTSEEAEDATSEDDVSGETLERPTTDTPEENTEVADEENQDVGASPGSDGGDLFAPDSDGEDLFAMVRGAGDLMTTWMTAADIGLMRAAGGRALPGPTAQLWPREGEEVAPPGGLAFGIRAVPDPLVLKSLRAMVTSYLLSEVAFAGAMRDPAGAFAAAEDRESGPEGEQDEAEFGEQAAGALLGALLAAAEPEGVAHPAEPTAQIAADAERGQAYAQAILNTRSVLEQLTPTGIVVLDVERRRMRIPPALHAALAPVGQAFGVDLEWSEG